MEHWIQREGRCITTYHWPRHPSGFKGALLHVQLRIHGKLNGGPHPPPFLPVRAFLSQKPEASPCYIA